jgi:hypothetical protein
VVYTALQGEFDATLTGMEKGNASSFTKRCLFQLTVQIIEFLRVLKLFCEIYFVRNSKLEEQDSP